MEKYVYKIRNKINGKVYIGQTNNLERRLKEHKFDKRSRKPIHDAIKKYGFENFEVTVEYFGEDYNDKEKELISLYDSQNREKGYNIQSGGQDSAGEDNPMSKITELQKAEVENLLLDSSLSMQEIGQMCNVSYRTVSNINLGNAWRNPTLTYPLRQNNIPDNTYQSIIKDLLNTDLSFDDLATKYDVKRYVILNVNKGTSHKQENLEYPLRKIFLNDKDVLQVIDMLKNTKLQQKEIADILGVRCSTVYHINVGTCYRIDGIEYPIRK